MKLHTKLIALIAVGLLTACASRQPVDDNAGSVPMGPPVVDISKPAPSPGVATKSSNDESTPKN